MIQGVSIWYEKTLGVFDVDDDDMMKMLESAGNSFESSSKRFLKNCKISQREREKLHGRRFRLAALQSLASATSLRITTWRFMQSSGIGACRLAKIKCRSTGKMK